MPDTDKTEAENKASADEIKDADATQHGARGNVHSEPEEPTDQQAPPPMPG